MCIWIEFVVIKTNKTLFWSIYFQVIGFCWIPSIEQSWSQEFLKLCRIERRIDLTLIERGSWMLPKVHNELEKVTIFWTSRPLFSWRNSHLKKCGYIVPPAPLGLSTSFIVTIFIIPINDSIFGRGSKIQH